MPFFGLFFPLSGSLRGAGDTRTPFYARLTGTTLFLLGFSYLAGVTLGYGLLGVYAGIVLSYAWWALVVGLGFLRLGRLGGRRGGDDGRASDGCQVTTRIHVRSGRARTNAEPRSLLVTAWRLTGNLVRLPHFTFYTFIDV